MNHPTLASRRSFLQRAAALSTFGAAAPLALNLASMGEAAAQSTSSADYKALVCIFLYGGNDAFNTVLATDQESWSNYTQARRQAPSSIALLAPGVAPDLTQPAGSPAWLGGVKALHPTTQSDTRTYALHPLLSNAQTLFNNKKRLAVISNVGPLEEPLSKTDYFQKTRRIPKKLFSHNDQQNTWMAMQPEGATNGWGGKIADYFSSENSNSLFTAISANGNSVWLTGNKTQQYQISPNGIQRLGLRTSDYGSGQIFGSSIVAESLRRITTMDRTDPRHPFTKDIATTARRALAAEGTVLNNLPGDAAAPFGPASRLSYQTLSGSLQENPLAKQLQMVARLISMSQGLGVRRQVFFVSMSGFDTHDNQNQKHAELMARLDHAVGYFYSTVENLGLAEKVTAFTASEFGRTFTSNGDGTDHGWGGHQLVFGGAVNGGRLFGQFPEIGRMNSNNTFFDSSRDQLRNGVLLPTTSVDQMAFALGRWFGVSSSDLIDVLPNVSRFDTGPNLAFL